MHGDRPTPRAFCGADPILAVPPENSGSLCSKRPPTLPTELPLTQGLRGARTNHSDDGSRALLGHQLKCGDTIETCWGHRVEPFEYLRSVTSEVSKDPSRHSSPLGRGWRRTEPGPQRLPRNPSREALSSSRSAAQLMRAGAPGTSEPLGTSRARMAPRASGSVGPLETQAPCDVTWGLSSAESPLSDYTSGLQGRQSGCATSQARSASLSGFGPQSGQGAEGAGSPRTRKLRI